MRHRRSYRRGWACSSTARWAAPQVRGTPSLAEQLQRADSKSLWRRITKRHLLGQRWKTRLLTNDRSVAHRHFRGGAGRHSRRDAQHRPRQPCLHTARRDSRRGGDAAPRQSRLAAQHHLRGGGLANAEPCTCSFLRGHAACLLGHGPSPLIASSRQHRRIAASPAISPRHRPRLLTPPAAAASCRPSPRPSCCTCCTSSTPQGTSPGGNR